ncbi:hypothetical protein [Georgenia deserti]|uniref:Phage holin family protein n=1 Tax=Georgenia deserti TaxID=2093781 RepID=A0ABW4L2W3_9MICO
MTQNPSSFPSHSSSDGAAGGAPSVRWSLVLGLGALALARPLARITGVDEVLGTPATAIGLTLLITALWVTLVGIGRVPRPVLTLTLAGVAYAVYSTLLSGILSPLLTGTLQGPLAQPIGIVAILATNAIWGAVAGVLALGVQRLRGGQS